MKQGKHLLDISIRQIYEAGETVNLVRQCQRVSGNRCCHRSPLMVMSLVDRELSAKIENL